MNLLTKRRSPTSRVGTMLSEGIQNDLTTNGLIKPKTSTTATRMMTTNSARLLPLFFPRRKRRISPRSFGASSFQRERFSFILEKPDARQRPEAHERLTLDVLVGNRSEEARVAGVGPVVPHREDTTLRHPCWAKEAAVVREPLVDIGIILHLAVHTQHAVLDRDFVPRHGHDAFDQVFLPTLYAPEDE